MATAPAPAPVTPSAPQPQNGILPQTSVSQGEASGSQTRTTAADESFDKAFPDLDELAAPSAPKESKPESKTQSPEPAKEQPAKEPGQPEKSKKPSLDDDDEPASAPDKDLSQFKTPKDLRDWAKRQAQLAEERQAEITKREAKIEELNKKLQSLQASPQNTEVAEAAIRDRITKLESQLQDREKELYTMRWEKSPEYKQQYEQPYLDAVGEAYEAIRQLFVVQTNDEGEQTQRPANEADFVGVYRLPYGQAYSKAKELFGDLAPVVMQHYATVHSQEKKALRAIEEHKTKAAEFEKEQTAKQALERERYQRAWASINEQLPKKYPQWFGPEDGDTEGNDILKKSYESIDPAFVSRESLTPQQAIVLDARIRHQAAAFPRMALKLKRSDEKIAALEKELENFRNSQPNDQKRPSNAAPQEPTKSWEEALDSM